MEKVLHLFINKECGHDCPLCCNKLYKLDEIPVVTVELLKSVKTVCLTGGDPMCINPNVLGDFIIRLRKQYKNIQNLYIYTSGKYAAENFIFLLGKISERVTIDGLNIAPKNIYDWIAFVKLIKDVPSWFFNKKTSNRLYVFKEQRPVFDALHIESLKDMYIDVIDRQWTKSFNTPDNEYFARLPILF